MTKTYKCPNCLKQNSLKEQLVSEITEKDDFGNVIKDNIAVVIDDRTLIKCDNCGYPIQCK